MKTLIIAITLLTAGVTFAAEKKVFFIEPKDNAVVATTFKVKMGVKGVKVCEANKETKNKKCGHHHILIDQKPIAAGQVVPKDENHVHFGQKQTETELTLKPGKHTLTLQFADFAHLSYGEKLSSTITVEVK